MRIAVFSESYEPIVNGVSVFVATLREGLVKRGHEVYVFAPRFKGHADNREDVFRFPSAHTWLMPDYPFPIPFAPQLRRKFQLLRFDIVHTQTPFLLGVVAARWARRCGIPLVSTNHTLYTEYAHYVPIRPMAVTKISLIKLMKWYYSGCDAVVVPSSPVEAILRSYGIKTPIRVIKTGVVPARALTPEEIAQTRAQVGMHVDDPMLLYVGRIAREKNLAMLIDAFKRVSLRYPRAVLFLVGGGPAFAETRARVSALGLDGRVRFLGMLPRERIDPLYRSADVFVFPSATETQGIAICEALSAGLPVVAVAEGGIPENVRHGLDGFLTRDNPEEFADRITFLLANPAERTRMRAEAQRSSDQFSLERMACDFEQFYKSVIERSLACAAQPAQL